MTHTLVATGRGMAGFSDLTASPGVSQGLVASPSPLLHLSFPSSPVWIIRVTVTLILLFFASVSQVLALSFQCKPTWVSQVKNKKRKNNWHCLPPAEWKPWCRRLLPFPFAFPLASSSLPRFCGVTAEAAEDTASGGSCSRVALAHTGHIAEDKSS